MGRVASDSHGSIHRNTGSNAIKMRSLLTNFLSLLLPVATSAFVSITPRRSSSAPFSARGRSRRPSSITSLQSSAPGPINNVVLSPSDDGTKFDSHSIGTARVHRYLRDDGSDDAEYVMW